MVLNCFTEKSAAREAFMPSFPIIPIPTFASWIILTSFPPSPTAHTRECVCFFNNFATAAYYAQKGRKGWQQVDEKKCSQYLLSRRTSTTDNSRGFAHAVNKILLIVIKTDLKWWPINDENTIDLVISNWANNLKKRERKVKLDWQKSSVASMHHLQTLPPFDISYLDQVSRKIHYLPTSESVKPVGRTNLALRAMQVAVSILSPVNINTRTPAFRIVSSVSHTFTEKK